VRDGYPDPETLTVGEVYRLMGDRLKLTPVVDGGMDNRVLSEDVSRPGLCLTGYTHKFLYERIQIFGETEITYLSRLTPEERGHALDFVFSFPVYCCMVTKGLTPPDELLERIRESGAALFCSPRDTTPLIHDLSDWLGETFAPRKAMHGTLVDVFGIGLLCTGRSAIGKSEAVLGLVERGHRLVADDSISIRRTGDRLLGTGDSLMGYHMEIRGLGMVDVAALYGVKAVKAKQQVDMEVRLKDWSEDLDYDRTGLEQRTTNVLGVRIPLFVIPVLPGRNITLLLEVAAMEHLLRTGGSTPARLLNRELIQRMRGGG
jgi:HPr kinase/phosphorylase